MRITSFQKLLISAAISTVVLLSAFGVYVWTYKSAGDFREQLVELELEVQKLELERQLARKFSGLAKERGGDITRIKKFLVDRERPVVFIEDLEGLAQKSQVLLALDFDEGKSKGNELFFRVTADGSERALHKFIAALELVPYEITLNEFLLQKISEKEIPAAVGPAPETSSRYGAGRKPPAKISPTHRTIISMGVRAQ